MEVIIANGSAFIRSGQRSNFRKFCDVRETDLKDGDLFDLEGVTYISSVGLRVLLAAQKKVRLKNGSAKLVSL